ncbi:MAG: arginine--tRNA ligase [Acidimicrobiia bacterium]
MSLLSQLGAIVGEAFEQAGLDRVYGEVVVSQRPELGQFQCNGALAGAKAAGRNPRDLAEEVAAAVKGRPEVAGVEVAGPGFINLTVDDEWLAAQVQASAADRRLGVPKVAEPRHVLLDFSGPNVAKAMHVGHLRPSVIGDSLQRLFRFAGHRVTSDIHLGDWGTQMGMLIVELERRAPGLPYFDPDFGGPYPEEPPVTLDDLQMMYPEASERYAADPTWAELARLATLELQGGRPGYRALWRHFREVSLASQGRDLGRLGVHFDLWHGESTVHDRTAPMIDRLRRAGHAEESSGALIVRVALPEDKAEVPPLLLEKSDGAYMYATADLATIEERVEDLGADDILYVVDARQSLHFEQVFRAAYLSGTAPPRVLLEHVACGTMNAPDGRPFRTRAGGVATLGDLIEDVEEAALRRLDEADIARGYQEDERREIAAKVAMAALKFGDLANHRTSDYLFDLDRFTSFEGRTGPYLLYGAVRIKSILRKAADRGLPGGAISAPTVPTERDLMLELARLPEVIGRAIEYRAPNYLAEFAYELATRFNRFYDTCHILREEDVARQASWLALVEVTLRELELVLDLLGIEIPERM